MASALVGFTSVAPYLIPPMASRLVTAEVRRRLIGRVAAGVFAGVLVAGGILGECES